MTNVIMFGATGRPNPERFKEARRAKGLSQTDLANALGVTRQSVSSYELGERQPDPATFIEISRILDQPLSFFTGARPEAAGPNGPAFFRSRRSKTKSLNDRCEIWREWFSQCANLFSEYVKFPEVSLLECSPQNGQFYRPDEIEAAASACRRAWGLGDGPIANVLALIESKGVVSARARFDSHDVDAFSFWSGKFPMIILASDKNVCVRARFDAAHELGHLILHRGFGEEELENKESLDQIESEANRFAGAFLMPADSYAQEVFTLRLAGFVHLKERWKVSVAAQIYRCLDLGLISDDQALNLRKQISKQRWNKREPLDDKIKPEEPTLLRKSFELIVSSGVATASEIATKARLNVQLLAAFYNVDVRNFSALPHGGPELKLNNA